MKWLYMSIRSENNIILYKKADTHINIKPSTLISKLNLSISQPPLILILNQSINSNQTYSTSC